MTPRPLLRALRPVACAAVAVLLLAACTSAPPVEVAELVAEDRKFADQKTDTKIKAGVITDINNRMGTTYAATLNVDVYEQRVLLTGAVENDDDRAKAGRVAYAVPDVKQVINEIQVVPPDAESSTVDDLVVEEKLTLKLASTQGVSHTNWRIRSVNGTVYLFGRSLSSAETGRVLAIAKDTEDVRKVVNHAVVRAQ